MKLYNITNDLLKGEEGYRSRPESQITEIVIHHSAAPAKFGPHDFAQWHVQKNGWPGIGYHYVIVEDGTVYQTNAHETISYHCGGYNSYTLGICLSGDFDQYAPTEAQKEALIALLKKLRKQLPQVQAIKGHRDYKSTNCPGRYLELEEVRGEAAKRRSPWLALLLIGLGVISSVLALVWG